MADMIFNDGDGVVMHPDHGRGSFGHVGPGMHPSYFADARGAQPQNAQRPIGPPPNSPAFSRAQGKPFQKLGGVSVFSPIGKSKLKPLASAAGARRSLKKGTSRKGGGGVTRGGYGPASR